MAIKGESLIDPGERGTIEALVRKRYSDVAIGRIYGTSDSTVQRFRKRHNISSPLGVKSGTSDKLLASERDKIQILVNEGNTYNQIGGIYGVTHQTVQRYFKRHDIDPAKAIGIPKAPARKVDEAALYRDQRYEDVCETLLRYEFFAERQQPHPRVNIAAIHDPQPGRVRHA